MNKKIVLCMCFLMVAACSKKPDINLMNERTALARDMVNDYSAARAITLEMMRLYNKGFYDEKPTGDVEVVINATKEKITKKYDSKPTNHKQFDDDFEELFAFYLSSLNSLSLDDISIRQYQHEQMTLERKAKLQDITGKLEHLLFKENLNKKPAKDDKGLAESVSKSEPVSES